MVLLCLFLCLPLLSVRSQDQRAAAKRQRNPLKVIASYPYHKWLDEDVRYIITDQERTEYLKLTNAKQWDDFVEAFWERRNPTPGSKENPFKEEHYRRFAYTNEHFASGVAGWRTDRGRFYIMYGPPDSVDSKPGFAPPTETWHYTFIDGVGRNVVLTFKDECVCGKYQLSGTDSDSQPPKIFDPLLQ